MANLPECVKCGQYVNWGFCLCYDHMKEVYYWISDVMEKGLTDDLKKQGEKHIHNFNAVLENEADKYQP